MQTLSKKTTKPETAPVKKYTVEEYLALEEKAEYKNEYRNGEIIKMAGGTTNHNKIGVNICRKFPLTIGTENYELFISDVRLWIPEYNLYTYPDLMIVAGEPIYQGKGTSTITNPTLIIEVLSLSTQEYDRGGKFKYYRSLPQMQEYILIDQYQYGIEQFAKNQEGKWVLTEYENEQDMLKLESIAWEIPLTDIYERVNFGIEEYDQEKS
ncbi:MAG: Uma2 family endonuclease [Gomphosphaeria aponina SAG 52.96 = DSM 107014]|uniref:Uma2 family endonuclease n=1 Tax=Gomphosphaeria aponina SAG 52.96 = DSM 107014 TaxID=1521640 RepID=A0A941GN67_9CHRO|nr:Uma2 family endonuclease [Gomphosphaeria aponina SAG 52.96 = DSM 107014]